MIYEILSYEIRLWDDDHEIINSYGISSLPTYEGEEVNNDLMLNEDVAVSYFKEHVKREQPNALAQDDVIEGIVIITQTVLFNQDYFGEWDCKYDLLEINAICYDGSPEEKDFKFLE